MQAVCKIWSHCYIGAKLAKSQPYCFYWRMSDVYELIPFAIKGMGRRGILDVISYPWWHGSRYYRELICDKVWNELPPVCCKGADHIILKQEILRRSLSNRLRFWWLSWNEKSFKKCRFNYLFKYFIIKSALFYFLLEIKHHLILAVIHWKNGKSIDQIMS